MTRENTTTEQKIANAAMEATALDLRKAALHSKSQSAFELLSVLANEFDQKYPTQTTLKTAQEKSEANK